jgi:hypothetical protein
VRDGSGALLLEAAPKRSCIGTLMRSISNDGAVPRRNGPGAGSCGQPSSEQEEERRTYNYWQALWVESWRRGTNLAATGVVPV